MSPLLEFFILVAGGTILGGFGSMAALLVGMRLQGSAAGASGAVSSQTIARELKQDFTDGDGLGGRTAGVSIGAVKRDAASSPGQQIVMNIGGKQVAFEVLVLPAEEGLLSPVTGTDELVVRCSSSAKGEMAAPGRVNLKPMGHLEKS